MTSSKEDDPEVKAVALLQQIKSGLVPVDDETPADRAERLEKILMRVSDVLTLYGANIFTLAVHQVQIIKQLSEIESLIQEKSAGKMPVLPHFRRRHRVGDADN